MNKIMPPSLSGKAKANEGNTNKNNTRRQRGCRNNSVFEAILQNTDIPGNKQNEHCVFSHLANSGNNQEMART